MPPTFCLVAVYEIGYGLVMVRTELFVGLHVLAGVTGLVVALGLQRRKPWAWRFGAFLSFAIMIAEIVALALSLDELESPGVVFFGMMAIFFAGFFVTLLTVRGEYRSSCQMDRAFHYAGDQHLPAITQNGIETWGDAGFAFCVPSIAAGYPRSWLPDKEGRVVQNRAAPKLANTGEYRDGFGNYVTVYGIGNPADKNRRGRENRAHDKSSGHGIVRFDPAKQTITMECYRVQFNPKKVMPRDQFPGWPKTIKLTDNRRQRVTGHLPEVVAPKGVKRPVLRVSSARSGELVYALRLSQIRIKPWVFSNGKYKVEFGDPDTNEWTVVRGVSPQKEDAGR